LQEYTVIAFEVNDMTCGHCAGTITQAVKAVDRDARVVFDLGRHQVRIEPGTADVHALGEAIKEAGYTPVPVQDARPATSQRRSCCCS